MFSSGDLNSTPTPPQKSFYDNRLIGGLLLVIATIVCIMMVISLDSAVFIPFNATLAVTQTWQAAHPATATVEDASNSTEEPHETDKPQQSADSF
jgi:hypothetical protein